MGVYISKMLGILLGRKRIKICIVGVNNAGKTTALYQFHLDEVVVTQPTIGSNVEEIQYGPFKISMWDLGGQESFRRSWHIYFVNTSAVMVVVDSTDRDAMETTRNELFRMLELDDLRHAVILVLANKQDVKGALSAAQVSEALNLHRIKDHDWHIQACCALTGEGLHDGLDWIIGKMRGK